MDRIPRASCRLAFAVVLGLLPALGCSDKSVNGPGDSQVPPPFAASSACQSCHPDQVAEWESSRHAFSGTDPVMHRMSQIAGAEVGAVCKQCHAPAQRRLDRLEAAGVAAFGFEMFEDGLNCDVCHSISEVPPVATADFLDAVDPTGPKYANLPDPVETPAHASERRTWYGTSVACASCHQFNLADGTGLENSFIEWEASSLAGMGIECQACHMPIYTGKAATTGPLREGLHRHKFVGPDYTYMAYRGIDLAQQKADVRELMENSVSVTLQDLPADVAPGSSFTFGIKVLNDKTGHSIPSGVSFAREMWIAVTVSDGGGGVVYRSGWLQADDDLVTTAEDPDLVTFSAHMFDAAGLPTPFAWLAASIDESGLLPYLATRTASFTVPVPADATGPLTAELALRFRSLPPGIVRELGLESILPIEVFDMWRETRQIAVIP